MKTISVAVVDDEISFRESVKENLRLIAEKDDVEFKISEFESGTLFLGAFSSVYDLILMDIDMPNLNGIETAKAVRKMDRNVLIIFITNMPQYALQGYEVEAFDFIVKPINMFGFQLKMQRALLRLEGNPSASIQVQEGREKYTVKINDILYLEAQGHYVVFHSKERDYTEYMTFKEAISRINASHFALCNRCYYVNLNYITAILKEEVQLGDDIRLLISRPQRHQFVDAYSSYLGGKR